MCNMSDGKCYMEKLNREKEFERDGGATLNGMTRDGFSDEMTFEQT